MSDCGGCEGKGSHRKWCRVQVGTIASIYGHWSQQAESIGDSCGDPETANLLWAAAGRLRDRAQAQADRYMEAL